MEDTQPVEGRLNEEALADSTLLANRFWIYASFVFLVIAATFGPVASVFNICAMIRPWRIGIASGSPKEQEPKNLMAINAILVVVALAANGILLRNMAHRIKTSIAQPITIVGWYIASFGLLAIIVAASELASEHPGETWSQAYYYCIYAAVIYFFIASLMLFNILGSRRHHNPHDKKLSSAMRALMVHSIGFLLFVFLGALVFSHIEGWIYLDAVYWADTTLLTIGLGDFQPQTILGRALLFPYAIFGVLALGLTLSAIRRLVLDKSSAVRHASALATTEDEQVRQTYDTLRDIQTRAIRQQRWSALAISLSIWLTLWFGGAAIFMTCERQYQQWTYFEALYFSFTSLLTIGYGDLAPVSNSGRSFFVLWTLVAVPTITILLSNAEVTVIGAIRDVPIFLAKISILPGDEGYKKDMRDFLNILPFRRKIGRGCSGKKVDTSYPKELPESRRKYHAILIDEIIDVVCHLKEQPEVIFSLDQWLWYQKLVEGYDVEGVIGPEPSSQPRRMGNRTGLASAAESSGALAIENSENKIGQNSGIKLRNFGMKSPLIGPREEVEWVLGRLMETLKRELTDMANQEQGG